MSEPATRLPPVAVLAGGLATRLRPVTERVPKILVDVAGRPFLEHQADLLRRAGFTEIVLCVGHLGESVERRYGDGRELGVRLRYSYDGPHLLGTGGALRQALPALGPAFLVLYGDSYLPTDYRAVVEAFRRCGAPALMTVFHNAGAWDASNVWWENGRIVSYRKGSNRPEMRHIDYGLSVCTPGIFDPYPANAAFDLAAVFEGLSARGELAGYEVRERFYEIGSPTGLRELDGLLRDTLTAVDGAFPSPSDRPPLRT